MNKANNQSEETRAEALKRTIEAHAGMPVDVLARGGRNVAEEAERFLQNAQAEHAAATPREK